MKAVMAYLFKEKGEAVLNHFWILKAYTNCNQPSLDHSLWILQGNTLTE